MDGRIRVTSLLAVVVAVGVVFADVADAQRQQQRRLYRWVDRDGNVHYSDNVPAEYADVDRDILNQHGVAVATEEGAITEAEREEIARREREEAERRQRQEENARRDNMLLETYLTVQDIEDLRDRRLELLESQIKVTELYLANLRKRLAALQAEAARYKPHNQDENAQEMPDELALDITRTLSSIQLYEQRLARTRADQEEVRAAFDRDIARFKELKGG